MTIPTGAELRGGLAASLGVARWVDEVAAAAPYASLDALLAKASAAATPLSPSEIDEAVAHHPRIGEQPRGEGTAQAFSRSEQASLDAASAPQAIAASNHAGDPAAADPDADLAAALAAGNAAYEERFGRVFLIRAAGRTRAEIVAELQRRLTLDDETELTIVGDQLRDIALLRLEKLYGETA